MIRSALLVADDTPGSLAAARLALTLAARLDIPLGGLAVVDEAALAPTEPVPLGGLRIKAEADARRIGARRERLTVACERLVAGAAGRHLAVPIRIVTGDGPAEVARAALVHDLVVTGRDSHAGGNGEADPSPFAAALVRNAPRPVLLVPPHAPDIARVLVTTDGSPTSARAMQALALLGLGRGLPVDVTSIAPDQATAEALCRDAGTYLARHGLAPVEHPVAGSGDPAEAVLDLAAGLGSGLIVMGAFGQRGWMASLFGSCTTRLLAEAPVALLMQP